MTLSRNIIALLFISSTVNAQTSVSIESAMASLRENCNYDLGEDIFSKINSADINIATEAAIIRFNLDIPLSHHRKNGAAKLLFGCNVKPPNPHGEKMHSGTINVNGTTTAKEEITNQDSGGRYGRVIDWQRSYKGENFRGTVAHIDSIFGDGVKIPTAEEFYICPAVSGFVCFSLIFDESLRLTKSERLNVVKLLQHVRIVPAN